MKRVSGVRYLYQRGGSFIFRRGVPPYARAEFDNHTEVHISVGQNLTDARYYLARHLARFDAALTRAKRSRDAEKNTIPQLIIPSRIEVDEAVRQWLRERLERADESRLAGERGAKQAQNRVEDLNAITAIIDEGMSAGGEGPGQNAEWIAEHLVEKYHWDIGPDTALYEHLLRMIGRGQREAAIRQTQDLDGRPFNIQDATFSEEQYRLDAERREKRAQAVPVSIRELMDRYVAVHTLKPKTVRSRRRQIEHFIAFIGHDDAKRVTPQDVSSWQEHLLLVLMYMPMNPST